MKTVTLDIQGMHCGGCQTGIEMVTQAMDGVTESKVDLEGAKGEFTFDETVISADDVIAEIGKLEYKASLVSNGDEEASQE